MVGNNNKMWGEYLNKNVRMAERSKAPDSSSGLRERAWVQIPLLTFYFFFSPYVVLTGLGIVVVAASKMVYQNHLASLLLAIDSICQVLGTAFKQLFSAYVHIKKARKFYNIQYAQVIQTPTL